MQNPPPAFSGTVRLQSLDLVRAMAVFLVLGHHASFRFSTSDPIAQMFKRSGWIGVDIFFAISGFMITGILIRDLKHRDVVGFFVRRAYRIVPLFGVAMGSFVVLSLIDGTEHGELLYIWSPALLLNGWTIPFLGVDKVPYTIAWSLSVEETAYALLGLTCLGTDHKLRRTLCGLLIVAIVVRWLSVATGAIDPLALYYFVPARLDAIGFGGLGALGTYGRLVGLRLIGPLAGFAMLSLVWFFQYLPPQNPMLALFGYAVFGFVCAIFITSLGFRHADTLESQDCSHWVVRGVASFGKLSYFVYLFHLFVLDGLVRIQAWIPGLELSFWSAVVLASMATYGLAVLSWRYFEHPLIRRGKAWGTLAGGSPATETLNAA